MGFALILVVGSGCSSGDDNNSSNNTNSNNTNNTANNTNNTANNINNVNNANNSGGGEFLRATGTFNGEAFSVDCDPDDEVTSSFTSGGYLGHDSCFAAVGNHQIQCVTTEEGIGGVQGTIVVNLSVNTAADDTVALTGSLDTMNVLNVNNANLADMTVTVDTFEADVGTSGSFSASWTDDGGPYGEVSGTFNFNCDVE